MVATVAARHTKALRTFTVSFPDLGTGEGEQAAAMASTLGSQHDTVPVTGAEVASDLETILSSMDQPTVDGVNTWLVCRAARQAGLVVALSGVGGDELFGGYPTFGFVPRVQRMTSMLRYLPARAAIARLAGRRSPGGRGARILGADPGVTGAYRAVRGLFSPGEVGPGPLAWNLPSDLPPDVRDAVTVLESSSYMREQLLRDTDQMSMAHSLEVRVPLLDDRFVRTALSVPASIRTEAGKALLARAGGLGSVPAKRPFALPFERWMRGPLRPDVEDALLSGSLPFADRVPAALRTRVWEGFLAGKIHWSRPWAIAVLRRWPGANGISV